MEDFFNARLKLSSIILAIYYVRRASKNNLTEATERSPMRTKFKLVAQLINVVVCGGLAEDFFSW